ncbi:citryl-CoA lyase, partial [Noviherbaspirillum denitrificans]|uniref:citryl-CoA lyase n=1 Tax=Noviherbaspirillum denitrificans TaxID=1968433 RepID=UPI0019806828
MNPNLIRSGIWSEEPEPDNPFAARAAYCRGYDVYGEMLGNARWVDMLYLLFRGERPTAAQADLMENLALALANPGPRDPSVHAAMCGGVGGSTGAASLMAALAVGAGKLGGGREVYLAIEGWAACGTDINAWQTWSAHPADGDGSIWPASDHPPGFDPNGVSTATPVRQALSCLARLSEGAFLPWLDAHREALERAIGLPLAMSGVAAAALADLGFSA